MNSTLRTDQIIYFGTANTPKVSCRYHEDNYIQIFCKKQECSLPLCPECIKIHSEEHEQDRVTKYLNLWAVDVQESGNLQEEIQKAQEFQLQKFQDAKKQFQKVIDDYFKMLESNILNETQISTQNLIKLVKLRHRIEYLEWKNQHENLLKLNSDKSMPPLISIYSDPRQTPQAVYQRNHQEHIEQLNRLKLSIRQVIINDNLNQIITFLKQYIQLSTIVLDSQIQQIQITNKVQPFLQVQPKIQNLTIVQTQPIMNQAINSNIYQPKIIQHFITSNVIITTNNTNYPIQFYQQQYYHPNPVLQEPIPMSMPIIPFQQSTPPQIIRSTQNLVQPIVDRGISNGQLRETMAQRYYDKMQKNEIK
ncbi:unnamed protein product [Paramecium primaurelia]|uniref:Uncharacterized protein n=1 Tax=Paramecium primaurelia TaxID=5886 RepID=A0A8S1JRB1_PARPR|nr:unnamed protein product [Paramecium primaurelia]CAD8044732.1 unnamed protein product [Paramecium primaurelia]